LSHTSRDLKIVSHFSRESASHFSHGANASRRAGYKNGPSAVRPLGAAAMMVAENGQQSPSGRRFGEILVDEGFINSTQLDIALQLQAVCPTYTPIGQVLLANNLITRKQLNLLLHRHNKRSRLGDILLKLGRITPAQLQETLAHQRRAPMPIGQMLVGLGYISGVELRDALCTQLHVNFFDLDPIAIDPVLAQVISERFAVRHLLVPLFRVDHILVVAMDDPAQTELIEDLQARLKLHIETVMTTTQKLKSAIARLYGPAAPRSDQACRLSSILIGPVRDQFVADLAVKGLRCTVTQ
jgi:type II secretion system (T2SS) protein E